MVKVKKENNQGVTLVALVVTIVLLLILVTASTSVLFGDGGLILAAKQAKILTICGQIDEYVNMRLLENQLNSYNNEEIEFKTFVDNYIIPELIEQNLLSQYSNLEITWEEDGSSVLIIDEQNETKTTINEINGAVSGMIESDYVSSKPTISYTITPSEGVADEVIITLTLTAQDELAKLECKEDEYVINLDGTNKEVEYIVKLNGVYTFTVTDVNDRTDTVVVTISNTTSANSIEYELSTEDYTSELELTIYYDENPTTDKTEVICQYKIGENGEYITANSTQKLTIKESTVVYARYFDGVTGYMEIPIILDKVAVSIEDVLVRGNFVTYNSQTWQVLHEEDSVGTNQYIEIMYPGNTDTILLYSADDFKIAIQKLNEACVTYYNQYDAVAYRHFGSNAENSKSYETILSVDAEGTNTTHHTTDVNAYIEAGIKNVQYTLLASRESEYTSELREYNIRGMSISGKSNYVTPLWRDGYAFYAYYDEETKTEPGLSPVISLNPELVITGGNGTEYNPYTFNF